jgi:hypothetical protein
MAANPFDANDTPSWMTEDSAPATAQAPQQPYAPPPTSYAPPRGNPGPPSGGYVPPNQYSRQSAGPQISWQDPAASFVSEVSMNKKILICI